jgi:hypothetical protein
MQVDLEEGPWLREGCLLCGCCFGSSHPSTGRLGPQVTGATKAPASLWHGLAVAATLVVVVLVLVVAVVVV